jgi:hypothetical protein
VKLLPFVEITLSLRHYLKMAKTVLHWRFGKLAVGIVSGFILAVYILVMIGDGFAAEIKIAWDPNTEEDMAGYKVYYGKAPWSFGEPIDVENVTSHTISGLPKGETYYIAVTAYDRDGNESGFSNQVSGKAHGFFHGEWIFNIYLGDKGGFLIRLNDDDATFKGYGISDGLNLFRIEGSYNYKEEDLILHGTYKSFDFYNTSTVLRSGNIHGEINKKKTTLTIVMAGNEPSAHMAFTAGEKVLKNSAVPKDGLSGDWLAKISGGLLATIDPLEFHEHPIDGNGDSPVFAFSESGISSNVGIINLDGLFIFVPFNKAYGIYEISGDRSELGFFSGNVLRGRAGFSFSLKSENGNRYKIRGKIKN